jgi:hypothetical protein
MKAYILFIMLIPLLSCASQNGTVDIPGEQPAETPDTTDTFADIPQEEVSQACTRNEDCVDTIGCTQDLCGVDGTCRHIADDSLCPDGQTCNPTSGCGVSECESDAECVNRDGNFCNGDERCYDSKCWPGTARDCDDGNPCTSDFCDTAADRCVNEWIPSCSSDASTDGDAFDPFDPAVHYSGTFDIVPTLSSSCGAATYNISFLQFTRTDARLTVQAGGFSMTQEPPPDGPSFLALYQQGSCGIYQLSGTFNNADEFLGRWVASFSGTCSMCSSQEFNVYGIRR